MKALALSLRHGLGRILFSPVLARELRAGLRERRIVIIQTVYIACIASLTLLVLLSSIDTSNAKHPTLQQDTGQNILIWTFIVQWLMVIMVAPSLTCGLLSSEREKQTYEMLVASLLSPAEIVGGKLLFGVSYVLYLLVSSLPVTATVFFLGGVSPAEVFIYYLSIFLSGLGMSQVALFFSAREKRTATATNQSYGVAFLWLIGGFILIPATLMATRGGGSQGTLVDTLMSTFEYRGLWIPYALLPLLTVAWFSVFLFVKTMNFVQTSASHVLWLHRLFIYWSVTGAFLDNSHGLSREQLKDGATAG